MPPKKATGAAAAAKEQKEKKTTAAPAHASYKGQFVHLNAVASVRNWLYRCRTSLLTIHTRYDQGRYHQCESTSFATTRAPLNPPTFVAEDWCKTWHKEIGTFHTQRV